MFTTRTIIFLTLLIPTLTLDFYFFQKFYNVGECKPKTELTNYVVKGNLDQPIPFDRLTTLVLMRQDIPVVDFGLMLSWKNKKGLEGAHQFFNVAFATMTETQRTYFPDMVSCVAESPWYSLFGSFDSYGIIYRTVPTLEEQQTLDLTGNRYSLVDLTDIFLDIFKAMQVIIQNQFYLTNVTQDDIGVATNVNDINAHIRGKFRLLHNLRAPDKTCDPSKNPLFILLKQKIESNSKRKQLHIRLGTPNPCQITNLVAIWKLYIDYLKKMFQFQENYINFNFDNCIENFTQANACPPVISKVWNHAKIKSDLLKIRDSALGYTAPSMATFFIFLLTRMKQTYMEHMVASQAQEVYQKLNLRVQKTNKIKAQKQTVKQIEQLELQILQKKPERIRKVVELDNKFKNQLDQMEVGDSQNASSSQTIDRLPESFGQKQFMEDILNEIDNDSDRQKLNDLEIQRKTAIKEEEIEIQDLQNELDAKKEKIRNRFRNIVKKVQVELQKDKIFQQQKATEIKHFDVEKANAMINNIGTPEFNETPLSLTQKNLFDDNQKVSHTGELFQIENQSNTNSGTFKAKTNLVIQEEKNSNKIIFTKSENSSDISGYKSSDSNSDQNNSQPALLKENPILSQIEHEELVINQIQVDLDEDFAVNQKIIDQFNQEVKETEDSPEIISEKSLIVNDKLKGLIDQEIVLKHELKEQVLETADSKIYQRELNKLETSNQIFQKLDQIKLLIDSKDPQQNSEIESLKQEVLGLVNGLITEYGVAENLTREAEGDQGLLHFTLGDLKDDLTMGEMKYIQANQGLQLNENSDLII